MFSTILNYTLRSIIVCYVWKLFKRKLYDASDIIVLDIMICPEFFISFTGLRLSYSTYGTEEYLQHIIESMNIS